MATWSIAQLEYNNDADKGVVIAHWRVTEEETVGKILTLHLLTALPHLSLTHQQTAM